MLNFILNGSVCSACFCGDRILSAFDLQHLYLANIRCKYLVLKLIAEQPQNFFCPSGCGPFTTIACQ